MDKAMDLATTVAPAIISLVTNVAIVGAVGFGGKVIFEKAQDYRIQSKPNEWLLIIRNGELLKCAVGLHAWVFPGDAAVKFPSQLNKLHFTAEQVTAEMQGVEVKGMLVWTIHRDKEGPFRCYKAFGDDLKRKDPIEANSQLQNMAISIIRDRIANFTINEILKNRQKLRNGVKDEMQKILTGWGMWVETCEILDVRVASRSLFANLQTEFREKSRQEAEGISANTENIIRQEALVRNQEFERLQSESETKASIFAAEQRLAVSKQEASIYEEKLIIERKKAEANNITRIRQEEMSIELQKKKLQFQGDNELYAIELRIKKEAEEQNYNRVLFETQQMNLDNNLLKEKKREDARLESMAQTLAVKEKGFTENVLKAMVLDTTKDIYSHLNIKEMKVLNMGGGSGGNQDPAGQMIAQVAASYKAISEAM